MGYLDHQKHALKTADSRILGLKDKIVFLKSWIRSPRAVGAIAPSSKSLARAVMRQIDPLHPGWIIELGAGTGAMTEALLEEGVSPLRLLVIERSEELSQVLKARFPDLKIVTDDAAHLKEIIERYKVTDVHAVVSSLPLLSLKARVRKAVLAQIADILGTTGIFVQYSYRHTSPIPPEHLKRYQLSAKRVGFAWFNMPPASVWRYQSTRG